MSGDFSSLIRTGPPFSVFCQNTRPIGGKKKERKKEETKNKEKGEPALLSRMMVDKWYTSESKNECGQNLAGQKATACLRIYSFDFRPH